MDSCSNVNPDLVDTVLNSSVRPLLKAHGGDVELIRIEGDTVYFRLTGACSGCPAADLTGEELVNNELKEHVPGVRRAVLQNYVSPGLLDEARRILKERSYRNQR